MSAISSNIIISTNTVLMLLCFVKAFEMISHHKSFGVLWVTPRTNIIGVKMGFLQ